MEVEYDENSDAAYIYLKKIKPAGVAKTYLCDPREVDGMINLDFDKNGQLIGIEVIDASKKLPQEILDQAKKINKDKREEPPFSDSEIKR